MKDEREGTLCPFCHNAGFHSDECVMSPKPTERCPKCGAREWLGHLGSCPTLVPDSPAPCEKVRYFGKGQECRPNATDADKCEPCKAKPQAPAQGEVREWTFHIGSHRVIVDYEMVPILKRFTWHVKQNRKSFYAHTNVKIGGKQTSISMHRLLCGLVSSEIDHINRDGLDNRRANLRFCSSGENQRNRVRKNSHGYRGVYKPKDGSLFAVQIQIGGKKYHERGFPTAEDAAKRYDQLSKEHHGEFGIRNFKD